MADFELSLDKMLRVVVTVVQQITTESNDAVLEEDKILAIIKIILNLMEQNGHEKSKAPQSHSI
jgi:hypothetical protein